MMQAVLEQPTLELPAALVYDLRHRGRGDGSAPRLEALLRQGLPVEPDPRRKDFYEATADGRRYWFYVRRGRPDRVYLLAVWR